MTKKIISLLCVLLAVSSFMFAQKITIKVASIAPSRSPWEIEQKTLTQEWSKITNGQVVLQFYDTSALGGEGAVIKKLRTVRPGQKSPVDGAVFTSIGVYELAPETKVLTLSVPYTFRNQAELNYALDNFSPRMKKAIEDQGYVLLGWFNVGWATFYTKEPVRTPTQVKALKMSSGGFDSPGLGNAFKAAGFNTEDIPSEKIAQSLKSPNGVKSLYSVPMYAYAAQYYKSLPYTIDSPICPIMSAFVISKDSWNTIPDKYKTELMASVKRTENRLIIAQQKADREYLDLIAAAGGILTKLTAEETALWESTFRKDAETMSNIPNSVIDFKFYTEILNLLDAYRAGKK